MKSATDGQAGYTIVEVMIFLLISGVLVMGAVALFNGRLDRIQFSQAVQNLASHLQTTANEVSTGTYDTTQPFNCVLKGSPAVPDIQPGGSNGQGSRSDCVFIGKVVNLTPADSRCKNNPAVDVNSFCGQAEVYTVVGRRLDDTGTQVVTTLIGPTGSKPTVVVTPDITERFEYGDDAHVTKVFEDDGSQTPVSGLGFFQSFGGVYNAKGLSSGAQNVEFWKVQTNPPNGTPLDITGMSDQVTQEHLTKFTSDGASPTKPIVVCVRSADNLQNASITIDLSAGGISPVTNFGDTRCPS